MINHQMRRGGGTNEFADYNLLVTILCSAVENLLQNGLNI
jgi:hypothetical protein